MAEEFEADPISVECQNSYGDRERYQIAVVDVSLESDQQIGTENIWGVLWKELREDHGVH